MPGTARRPCPWLGTCDFMRSPAPVSVPEGGIMKARVKWIENRLFMGETGSGHTVVLGTTAAPDGHKLAPSAMELMLVATGGCSAWDVVDILQKGRQHIDDCVVEVEGDRSELDPKGFVRIHLAYVCK